MCALGDSIEPFLKSVLVRFPERSGARPQGDRWPVPDNAADAINLTIDGVAPSVPKGTLLVEAAKHVRQEIPVYCYHPKLGPAGLCRICLVEIEGMPKLQIACNTPVAEGMVVRTKASSVRADGRATILELSARQPSAGLSDLRQGRRMRLARLCDGVRARHVDLADPKPSKPKAVNLGPTIVLDEDRCVVCQRCVRFDDIIAGERQLVDQGPGGSRHHRHRDRRSVPSQFHRQRDRALSGRRADVQNVPF